MKYKIGFFHTDSWPLTEGSAVQSWNICSQLSKLYDIHVLPTSPFKQFKKLDSKKGKIFLSTKQLDLIIVVIDGYFNFMVEKYTLIALLLRPFKKIPVIWLINAPIEESLLFPWYNKKLFFIHKLLRTYMAKYVDTGICVSASLEKYTKEQLKIRHTVIIPNGSDPKHFFPSKSLSSSLSLSQKTYNIVWAGNAYWPWQGIDTVIQVAKILEKRDPTIIFTIVSDKSWIQIPARKNILQLPTVTYEKLPEYLRHADVCLALYHNRSHLEFYNSPMKLFDYMAMEKPIIATRLGQINQILQHKENGILVDNDPKQIARYIQIMKNNPKKADKMGQSARTDVLRYYNWKRVALEIQAVIAPNIKIPRAYARGF